MIKEILLRNAKVGKIYLIGFIVIPRNEESTSSMLHPRRSFAMLWMTGVVEKAFFLLGRYALPLDL